MFTGIVTDVGEITSLIPGGQAGDRKFVIRTRHDMAPIAMGASIACSGCCLTVIEKGAEVTVELPDQSTTPGRVHAVGRTVAQPEGAVGGDSPQVSITVLADDLSGIDSAEVDVHFAGKVRTGVLAVPVQALVALSEGGYAVQTPAGLVGVTTGMFAQGWVEVSGDGLTEGTAVVVAS